MTSRDTPKLPERKQAGSWVQTDRATHEAWAKLSVKSPRASALLHLLAARVGDHNAVVVSQGVLAKLMGCSRRTIVRAIDDLVAGHWIEARQIGDNGTVNAYVLNDRVVWHGTRDGLRYSLFSAQIMLSEEEQPDRNELEQQAPLRRLPRVYPDERQLPSGRGLPPPSEPSLPGMEPDLPVTQQADPQEIEALTSNLGNRLRFDFDDENV